MKKGLLFCLLLVLSLFSMEAMAQRTVSGTVTDPDTGETLPGVTVLIKGTSIGTATDVNGNYSLEVPNDDAVLVYSGIGLSNQEITVGSQSVLDVSMSTSATNLDEVVISGLATSVKRSNLANAVSTISANDLVGSTRAQTLEGSMNGKVVGALITQNSGAPGGGFNVLLRGPSSLAGSSQPLYIVDGVYINNSSFANGRSAGAFTNAGAGGTQDDASNRVSDLNPADIENIEILKGSSAAAIYGTRANAGVIIITTKKGQSGKTKFSFGQDLGISSAIRLLGSSDWDNAKLGNFYSGQRLIDEQTALATAQANGQIYDYEKEIFGGGRFLTNTRLNVSGGNDKTKFFISGGFTQENGLIKNTGFNRATLRANIDHQISKSMKIKFNSSYYNTGNSRGFTGNDNNGVAVTYNLAYIPSYAQLFPNAQGAYPINPYTPDNPLAIIDKGVNNEKTNRFSQAINFEAFILSKEKMSLQFTALGGVDYLLTESEVFLPRNLQNQSAVANPGASRFSKNRALNTNLQFNLVFNAQAGKFDFTTTVGVVRLTNDFDNSFTQGQGIPEGVRNPSTANLQTFGQTVQKTQDVGIFGQQEINFDDKIIASIGIRFDKSSLNGNTSKFYAFPKASLAVNVANFDFWSFKDIVGVFKPRVAFGQTGGLPSFGNTFTNLLTTSIGGGAGLIPSTTIGNSNIEPEIAQELEFGLDLGFLKNRISLEATYYIKDVKNLIFPYTIASGTGYAQIGAFPVGDLQNTGLELGLNAQVVKKENISWSTTLNYWHNRTKVTRSIIPTTAIGNGFGAQFGTNQFLVGESTTRWFGLPRVTDANGVTSLTPYGESQPDFQMSWLNSIRFLKHFDFNFQFHWKKGGYNSGLTRLLKDEGGTSKDWGDDDDGDGIPNGLDTDRSDLAGAVTTAAPFLFDASYIRLREVSLYYTLPKEVINRVFGKAIDKARIGFSANNLLTITDYKGGYDPEVSNFGATTGGNVDLASYPNTKRMFFHIQIDF